MRDGACICDARDRLLTGSRAVGGQALVVCICMFPFSKKCDRICGYVCMYVRARMCG